LHKLFERQGFEVRRKIMGGFVLIQLDACLHRCERVTGRIPDLRPDSLEAISFWVGGRGCFSWASHQGIVAERLKTRKSAISGTQPKICVPHGVYAL
jgi:hypothetical protein